mgnify:CR=1 FL=1
MRENNQKFFRPYLIKSSYAIVMLLLMLTSCQKHSEHNSGGNPSYDANLEPSGQTLSTTLDSSTSNISDFLTYYHNKNTNTEYLISVNSFMNEIQGYDLKNGAKSMHITIDRNGAKGIGLFSAVHIENMDSLIVFPTQEEKIYLMDSAYQNFKNINYTAPTGYTNARPGNVFFTSNTYLEDGMLYVKTLFQTNFRTVSNEQLSKVHLGYAIDLRNGATMPMSHDYPDNYFEVGMKHYDFSASFSPNGFVYSFFGDHHLYVSKSANEKLKAIDGKSKYLKEELPLFPTAGDRSDRAKYASIMDHYGNLMYDPYREVYYRFCYPFVEINDMQEVMDNLHNPVTFSIQVFDKTFNIIGETLFEKNQKYLPKNIFVGKKGLYISTKHSKNQQAKEDEFTFELLQLSDVS